MDEPHFERITQPDYPALQIITEPNGRKRARTTAAWRDVDEVLDWLFELVRRGDVAVRQDETGEFFARITDQGYARAELYLRPDDPGATQFRTLLVGHPGKIVLSPAEERVLQALTDSEVPVEMVAEQTDLTVGQVLHALAVLRNIGLAKEQE